MLLFCAVEAGSMHERTVLPSTSTVQAPHCPSPQPKRGPWRPKLPRRTYSSGVSGSALTTLVFPFTFSEICAMLRILSRRVGQKEWGPGSRSTNSLVNIAELTCNIHCAEADGNAFSVLKMFGLSQ